MDRINQAWLQFTNFVSSIRLQNDPLEAKILTSAKRGKDKKLKLLLNGLSNEVLDLKGAEMFSKIIKARYPKVIKEKPVVSKEFHEVISLLIEKIPHQRLVEKFDGSR